MIDQKLLLTISSVELNVTSAKHKTCVQSFLDNRTSLHVDDLKDCALTVPASLRLAKTSENVTVSGTKGSRRSSWRRRPIRSQIVLRSFRWIGRTTRA